MKVAIYKNDGTFATKFEGITNPQLTDSLLTFDKGSIAGVDENHILLEDDVDIPALLGDATLYDQKSKYIFLKVNETEELKKQLAETNALILDFMESTLA